MEVAPGVFVAGAERVGRGGRRHGGLDTGRQGGRGRCHRRRGRGPASATAAVPHAAATRTSRLRRPRRARAGMAANDTPRPRGTVKRRIAPRPSIRRRPRRRSPARAPRPAPGPAGRRPPAARRRAAGQRGKKWAARARSCSTARIVRPSRSLRSARRSMTCTWWRRSRWTVGSSSRSSRACWATAMAMQHQLPLAERQLARIASHEVVQPDPVDGLVDDLAVDRASARGTDRSWGIRPSATTSSTRMANGRSTCWGTTAMRRAIASRPSSASGTPSSMTCPGSPAGRR